MPNNYRHNPFNDVSTAILVDETHIVPSTSPFYVRLNEIPQKNSPSTVAVKEITGYNADGPILGTTFAEVAANPAQGQVRLDYSTSADNDENWNTGLLQFNSADAGKVISVSYTATGTLASCKAPAYPNWWLDRGDGSDGDFIPTANVTISGVKNYTSVYIASGITVTVAIGSIIKCTGAVVNKGSIVAALADNAGFIYYNQAGAGRDGFCGVNGGRAPARPGGTSYISKGFSPERTSDLNYLKYAVSQCNIWLYSAGAGSWNDQNDARRGGGGAGAIFIVCTELLNAGTISANGKNGEDYYAHDYNGGGGGGGGGAVAVVAYTIVNTGIISAIGGKAGRSGSKLEAPTNGQDGYVWLKELGVM